MRVWSRSRGSMARSCTEKPVRLGQRAKSALIFAATSASRRIKRVSGRPGLNSRVFICSGFFSISVAENTTDRRESLLSGFACRATTTKTRERNLLVQRPRERLAAKVRGRLRRLLQELGQRLGDVLEDLAVLLCGKPRGDADVAHEQLVVLRP